ncbi:MAG TPA: FecR domain-containing protein [Puia sp.]|nr:FecR domain-containing protein [Puia sp.]
MRKMIGAAAAMAVAITVAAGCRDEPRRVVTAGKQYRNETQAKQTIALPDSSTVILAPGANIGLAVGFSSRKEVSLDGEAWFDIVHAPLALQTRDMVVEVLSASRFHAEAFRARPGEEIDLLEGSIRAKKSYHSDTDNEPEMLGTGDMVMINRDIDLMEKEKLNPAELDKLKAAW